MIGHSLNKMVLFLLAGNILIAYNTQQIKDVTGMFSRLPKTALLWMTALLFICGTPPSPLFVSELLLVRGAGLYLGGAVLLLLFVIFCGMMYNAMGMCMGKDISAPLRPADEAAEKLNFIPALVLILLLVIGCALIGQLALHAQLL